jgi:hypothetical protein
VFDCLSPYRTHDFNEKAQQSKGEMKMTKKNEAEMPEKEQGEAAQIPPSLAPKSMDELSASEKLPEVQENAIAAVQSEKGEKIEVAKKDGFDPEIHATNDDGTPKKTKSGNFAKKRGRKSTLNTGEKSSKEQEKEEAQEKEKQANLEAAVMTSTILEQMQMQFISEDFAYSDVERRGNIEAWEATFAHYGGVKMHPAVQLAASHATIIATRARKPTVQDKFAHLKTWFKTRFKRKNKNALPDNRTDAERKDNIREKESA